MHIEFSPKEVAKASSIVHKASRNKNMTPFILLMAKNNQLKIFASNSNLEISVKIGVNVIEEGSVIINADRFIPLLDNFPKDATATLRDDPEHKGAGNMAVLSFKSTVNHGTFSLRNMDESKIRRFFQKSNNTSFVSMTVNVKNLLQMLRHLIPSGTYYPSGSEGATKQSNFVYNVVKFMFPANSENLTMVCTDGSSLCETTLKASDVKNEHGRDVSVLLPFSDVEMSLVQMLENAIKTNVEVARLTFAEDRTHVQLGNYTMSMMGVISQYPDYKRVIPQPTSTYQIRLSRKDMVSALEQIAVVDSDLAKSGILELSITAGESSLSFRTVNCLIEVPYLAEPIIPSHGQHTFEMLKQREMFVNQLLLKEIIHEMKANIVTFSPPADAAGAYRLTADDVDALHVFMPIRPQNATAISGNGKKGRTQSAK